MTLVAQRRLALAVALMATVGLLALALPGPAGAGHNPSEPYFDLGALPEPEITGEQIVNALEVFADDHPYRLTGGPTELAAADTIHGELAALGYEAEIETIPLASGVGTSPLKAVTGLKRGTTRPDEWIMLVGHYDTVPQTIWGTYDNAAGTNLMLQLAAAFADVPTNRSIVFAFYNGEEQGVLASARHAAALKAADQDITAVLGFDMVGVAWPVAPEREAAEARHCLCMFHGARDGDDFRPLLEFVNHDFLGYPHHPRKVIVAGNNSRNSDERSFANQGYRTLRWAGMRTASAYPAYHLPDDTLDTMIEVAGGREYLEAGSYHTLVSAYYTALTLDNHLPVPDVDVDTDGLTVTLGAAGSTDPDGELSGFSWQLGDGTSAAGVEVTHTFDAPGTYPVTLSVADNLWPDVVVTTTKDVTVE